MYQDLKQRYWWYSMKRDVAAHVALCDTCHRVKAEHQRTAGLLQPLKVPEWKWEEIGMDFIVGLPRTRDGYDSIWVIVDRLTKVAHFILVKTTYTGAKLAELYMSRIVCVAWCTKEDSVRQRYPVHLSFLGEAARVYGYQVELQLSLSSTDRWTDREDQSDLRGHAESMCT
jgi:hypothetical protein